VSRYQNDGSVLVQQTQQWFGIDKADMIRPIPISNFSVGKCCFYSHQKQMFPHRPNDLLPFFFIEFGKCGLQVFTKKPAANRQNSGKKKGKTIGKKPARFQTQRLENAKHDSDQQINKIITNPFIHTAIISNPVFYFNGK
jgi:hypothetical protein